MAEQAKRERATAKGASTRANRRVISAIEARLQKEIIQERFETATNQWSVVMNKNEEYIQTRYTEQDEETPQQEEDWYDEVAAAFEAVEIKYHEYMKAMEVGGKDEPIHVQEAEKEDGSNNGAREQLIISQRMYEFEQRTMDTMMKEWKGIVSNEKSTEQVIKVYEQDAREQLTKLRNSQREIIRGGGDGDITALESEFSRLVVEAGKRIEELSTAKETKKKGNKIKMERMKLPVFSGIVREYPTFKRDFDAQVLQEYSEEELPYALKTCLRGEALDVIKNVDDDLAKMWERLKDKYGRASKLTDAIMIEIKKLKQVNEGDDKRFTEMVDIVERSWRDLKMIGMEDEISNSTVVSFIEEKLPHSVKHQWCLAVCTKEEDQDEGGAVRRDKSKFEEFLKFLLKHKRAMEYGAEQMRSSGHVRTGQTNALQGKEANAPKENCWIHTGVAGLHPIWKCREFLAKTPEERSAFVKEHGACRACLLKRCQGKEDPAQCKASFKCFEKGCRQPHNHLLHESKPVAGSTMHTGAAGDSQQPMLPLQSI